jgi:hypothetical protein
MQYISLENNSWPIKIAAQFYGFSGQIILNNEQSRVDIRSSSKVCTMRIIQIHLVDSSVQPPSSCQNAEDTLAVTTCDIS